MMMNYNDIVLTKEQQECVNYDAGDLLIRGVPGAGKSVVLLKRALKIYKKIKEENSQKKLAIFTYTNVLIRYTDEILSQKIDTDKIMINTIDSHCLSIFMKMGGIKRGIPKISEKKELIKEVLQIHQISSKLKHRFYSLNVEFWNDEFKWIKERNICTKEEYVNSDRSGRGSTIRMSVKDKEIAFGLFELYNQKMKEKNYMDFEDVICYILNNKNRMKEDMKIEYVLVDEAQDLSFAKLSVIKLLTKESLTIAADTAQKIYDTSFTWKELGINVVGRASKQLKHTFRSTKQIILLASSLLEHNQLEASKEYITPAIPEAEGPIPKVFQCANELVKKQYFHSLIKNLIKQQPDAVIGILTRDGYKSQNTIQRWLSEIGIPVEIVAKGREWSLLSRGVKMTTLHSAKGLEFDVVIIPFLEESFIPGIALNTPNEKQEQQILEKERSVLYVGMTRARNELFMMYAGEKSRFIDEFKQEYFEMV